MAKDDTDPLLASMAGALVAHGYLVHAPDKSAVKPIARQAPPAKNTCPITINYSVPAQRFRDHPNPEHVVFEMIREGFNQNLDDDTIRSLLRGGFLVLELRMIAGDKLQLTMRLHLQEQTPGPSATEVTVDPPPAAPATTPVALHIYGQQVQLPAGVSFPPITRNDMLGLKDAVRDAAKRAGRQIPTDPVVDRIIMEAVDNYRRKEHLQRADYNTHKHLLGYGD